MSKIEELKKQNEQFIKECFYNQKIWTKNQLAKETGLSLATTTNILQTMLENKEIIFIGEANSTGGRKSKQYQLNKDFQHILKVVLKRNSLYKFILRDVNLFEEIIFKHDQDSKTGTKDELLALIDEMLKKDSLISCICLSIPGICLDSCFEVCDFEQLIGVDLKKELKLRYQKQIVIENDVNVACIGFAYQYPHYQHIAFVYQPEVEYIGCGMIIDGKLYNGCSHFAGELRYLPFYSHKQQDELLKNNPEKLLSEQVETLCCIINPQVIGIYSEATVSPKLTLNHIPENHRPKLVNIDDLIELILKGLFYIGLKNLKERRE